MDCSTKRPWRRCAFPRQPHFTTPGRWCRTYVPSDLRAGQILLATASPHEGIGPRILDALISLSTTNPFDHALVVGNGHLIDPVWHVRRAPLDAYADHAWAFDVSATEDEIASAVAWAEGRIGQQYGLLALVEDGLLYDAHIPLTVRMNPRRTTCSGFVVAAYMAAGVTLTHQPLPSPASLSFSPLLIGRRPWETAGGIAL